MSKKYDDYLKTDYWKAVTAAVKKRAGWKCQICNSQHDLQTHHRTYENRGHEMEHLDDLICMCRRCHGIFHGTIPQPVMESRKERRQKARAAVSREGVNHVQVALDMPSGDPIILTDELIQRCRTTGGAFTNAAIRPLGVCAPLISGWGKRLVGKQVTRAAYQEALEGRYIYNSGHLPVVVK